MYFRSSNLRPILGRVFCGVTCLFLTFSALGQFGVSSSSVARLNADGGYDLVIAIEDGAPDADNNNVTLLFEDVEKKIQEFSDLLWKATDETFFINSVKFIIPQHWDDGSKNVVSISIDGCHTADICLHTSSAHVSVDNPNTCRLPGDRINLPLYFFSSDFGDFGPPEKALLKAWARYRWGTWEEHGFPKDKRFPYFHKTFDDGTSGTYEPTGCYSGTFQWDTDCNKTHPEETCRFDSMDPDAEPNSVSFIQWHPDVNGFCDKDTHVQDMPNRQNVLCGYRSVKEVMESSLDYKKLKTPGSAAPPTSGVNFEYYWHSDSPLFYLLLDASFKLTPEEPLEEVVKVVQTLFNHVDTFGTMGKIAKFSHVEDFQVLSDWSTFWRNQVWLVNQFLEAAERPDRPEPLTNGDLGSGKVDNFVHALNSVLEELRLVGHPEGAVVLVVKESGQVNNSAIPIFETTIMEQLRSEKIVLNAIEVRRDASYARTHLGGAVEASGGYYAEIAPGQNVASVSRKVIENLPDFFVFGIRKNVKSQTHLLIERIIRPNEGFDLPLRNTNLAFGTNVKVQLTLDTLCRLDYSCYDVETMNFTLANCASSPNYDNADIDFVGTRWEWGDGKAAEKRAVLEYHIAVGSLSSKDPCLNLSCSLCDTKLTRGHLLASYETVPELESERLDVELSMLEMPDLDPSHHSDFGIYGIKVYAKIASMGRPMVGLTGVNLVVHDADTLTSHPAIPMLDNGQGSVDANPQDGIYSGVFVPDYLGVKRCFITVEVNSGALRRNGMDDFPHLNYAVDRMLKVDQTEVGCPGTEEACVEMGLLKRKAMVVKYFKIVDVTKTDIVIDKVIGGRITDLQAKPLENFSALLEWTHPRIISTVPDPQINFRFANATSLEDLLSADDSAFDNLELEPSADPTKCSAKVSAEDGAQVMYYAIRAVVPLEDKDNFRFLTPMSNAVQVYLEESPVEEETTTTARQSSTTSTTTSEPPPEDLTSTATSTTTEPGAELEQWWEETKAMIMFVSFAFSILLMLALSFCYSRVKAFLKDREMKYQKMKNSKSIESMMEDDDVEQYNRDVLY